VSCPELVDLERSLRIGDDDQDRAILERGEARHRRGEICHDVDASALADLTDDEFSMIDTRVRNQARDPVAAALLSPHATPEERSDLRRFVARFTAGLASASDETKAERLCGRILERGP
jgi:hypothetical protein